MPQANEGRFIVSSVDGDGNVAPDTHHSSRDEADKEVARRKAAGHTSIEVRAARKADALEKLWRYRHLEEAGIFPNRMAAWRAVQSGALEPPLMLGPNSNAWTDGMIQRYLDSRPRRVPGNGRKIGAIKREAAAAP
jgi:hypothetical protein